MLTLSVPDHDKPEWLLAAAFFLKDRSQLLHLGNSNGGSQLKFEHLSGYVINLHFESTFPY
ncbi:hypothetical protein [Paenibacillus dendritiformis]|uniref:hypothetical protein n=1 Tax=Paenibacillus dendritiformis TaxID=130049 RepID=UPI00387E0D38